MPKFCPYCGNPVKESDKFCIICGKPLLTDIPKRSKVVDIAKEEKKEVFEKKPMEEELKIEEQKEEALELTDEENNKKKLKKKKEKGEVKPLPDTVKEQLEYYIEHDDIQINKKVLLEKLDEILKSTKESKYEYDNDFKKEINIKLEAVKTLISELKQKENEVKQKLEDPFIVQRLNNDINTKEFQLDNLTREYKLHKVDKDSFEKLREKYKQEKTQLENKKEDLIDGMKLWIQDLKLEKAEISGERKLTKGRFHAKEISEEQFEGYEKEFELKLKKISSKIKTLETLTK